MLPYFVLFGRPIPLYGVCMAAGIALAAVLAIFRAKRAGMDENDMIVILACAVGLGLVGAKALYLGVTYGLKGTLNLLRTGNFAILVESGQVYYGGLLFGIAGAVIAAMCLRVKGENVAYAVVPALPLGHAFGRIGCFLGGVLLWIALRCALGRGFQRGRGRGADVSHSIGRSVSESFAGGGADGLCEKGSKPMEYFDCLYGRVWDTAVFAGVFPGRSRPGNGRRPVHFSMDQSDADAGRVGGGAAPAGKAAQRGKIIGGRKQ